jgi:hypothetical protein
MPWKINGSEIIETSKINGVLWATGKKLNGIQLNVCYDYTLQNNNPPFPPQPDITFNYNDCGGSAQSVTIPSGGNQQVCALVDSVSFGGNGSATKGSRCYS